MTLNDSWCDQPDTVDRDIEQALATGWAIIPQVGHGTCDNALIRIHNGFIDIATVPTIGYATVVRLHGGPQPGHPRRVGHQWWRHNVPTQVAVTWVLTNPVNDHILVDWGARPSDSSVTESQAPTCADPD